MLKVENLKVRFGQIEALKGISFEVNQGEIVALIGSNGAGKTTTLRTISGLEKPAEGTILFEGTDLTRLPQHKIVELGVAHVPEGRRVFANMTIYENLLLGANIRKDKTKIKSDIEYVYSLFLRLFERKNQMAGTLSGGEQQMLAVGRALMTGGKILLLDEPSMGLAPIIVEEIFNIITEINKQGMTVLLIEQNAFMSLQIATRAYVLETGNITLSGTGQELLHMEAVKQAYLGI